MKLLMFIVSFTISFLISRRKQKRKWKREAEEYLKTHTVVRAESEVKDDKRRSNSKN